MPPCLTRRPRTPPRSGADASQQSALNLLDLLGFSGQGQLRIFGPSNEKYAIRGGCDQVPTRLAQGSRTRTVTVDRVVLALPFSILRSSVDFSGAAFRPLKPTPATRTPGTSPEPRAAAPASWSTSPGARSGRASARARRRRGPSSSWPQLEPVLPGITAKWNGRATVDFWLGNPWTKGSHSFWKVGQSTFAGEHTSVDFQGHLDGAVETGQRAAQEFLSASPRSQAAG